MKASASSAWHRRKRFALLQIETHRHTGGTGRREVEPPGGGNVRGNHFIEVLLQIPFFEERTLLQVFRGVNIFGPEARAQKTLFVKGAVIGGVMQYRAELFELIILNFFDRPLFASHCEFFEFAEPSAVPPAFGQQPIAKSDPVA